MSGLVLTGLDGANPLAFLASLGTLRLATLCWPEAGIRMRWVRSNGWRPELCGSPIEGPDEFCAALLHAKHWAPLEAFRPMGNNLTVSEAEFEFLPKEALEDVTPHDRRKADFATAFACEVIGDTKKDRIEFSNFCFITGSGHQDFLGTANALAGGCGVPHLKEALFGPWKRADKSNSFRWDPEDAKEYALQFGNPSKAGGVMSVWGANRLAFEGLPLFPSLPVGNHLATTGFRRRPRALTWPIWTHGAGLDTVRSLLSLAELQAEEPRRDHMMARGIDEVFRSPRVQIGQGANFRPLGRPDG